MKIFGLYVHNKYIFSEENYAGPKFVNYVYNMIQLCGKGFYVLERVKKYIHTFKLPPAPSWWDQVFVSSDNIKCVLRHCDHKIANK